MSVAAVVEPVAGGVEPFGFVDSAFSAVQKLLTSDRMSERDQGRFESVRVACETIGKPLLEAADRHDLDARMDEVIALPSVSELIADDVERRQPEERASDATSRPDIPWPAELFGGAVTKLRSVDRLMRELASARRQFLARVPRDTTQAEVEQLAHAPLAFLDDPRLPVEVKEIHLAQLRGNASLLAITQAIIGRHPPEPWLALALAEHLVEGFQQSLRLFASIPWVDVPTDVVPLADRLDVERLVRETEATDAWLHEFVAGAASDDTAYPLAPRAGR